MPRRCAAAMKTWQRSQHTPRLSAKASLALGTTSVISRSKTISRCRRSSKACACAKAPPPHAARTSSASPRIASSAAVKRVSDDAVGILSLDRAVNIDAQLGEWTRSAEHMGNIAKRVFTWGEARIGGYIDTPTHDVLAFMIARRQPQQLDRPSRGRVVPVHRTVADMQVHS